MPNSSSEEIKAVDVAIGVLLKNTENGIQILIARRPNDAVLGGYWEMPGGKVEPDETISECVVREFMEEVGVHVAVGEALPIVEHKYPYAFVRLHPFFCSHVDGAPQNLAVVEHKWVTPTELCQYEFPPANDDLMEEIVECLERLDVSELT